MCMFISITLWTFFLFVSLSCSTSCINILWPYVIFPWANSLQDRKCKWGFSVFFYTLPLPAPSSPSLSLPPSHPPTPLTLTLADNTWLLGIVWKPLWLSGWIFTRLLFGICRCMLSCFSYVRLFATQSFKPTRLLCLWDFPGKNTGVSCHALL